MTISKSELAEYLGVSPRTLSRWLNELYYERIKKLGYRKNQRLLSFSIVKAIFPEEADFIFKLYTRRYTYPEN